MKEVLGNAVLWPAQQLVNGLISSDAHVQAKLNAFANKAIQINTSSPSLNMRVTIETRQLRFTAIDSEQFELPVDATIEGPASKLFEQLMDSSSRQALVSQDLAIEGDLQLVQDMLAAIRSLDIDWQDYLSPVIGDVLTQQLGQSLNESRTWLSDSERRVRASLDDYLKEEARLFPQQIQISNFEDDLDALKLRVDRVHARIERLRQDLKALKVSPACDPTPS